MAHVDGCLVKENGSTSLLKLTYLFCEARNSHCKCSYVQEY